MNTLQFPDCTLQDLIKAISIASQIAELTDVRTFEVYVQGTFKDRGGELVFLNCTWTKVLYANKLNRRNKFFTVLVDGVRTQVTPVENFDISVNV